MGKNLIIELGYGLMALLIALLLTPDLSSGDNFWQNLGLVIAALAPLVGFRLTFVLFLRVHPTDKRVDNFEIPFYLFGWQAVIVLATVPGILLAILVGGMSSLADYIEIAFAAYLFWIIVMGFALLYATLFHWSFFDYVSRQQKNRLELKQKKSEQQAALKAAREKKKRGQGLGTAEFETQFTYTYSGSDGELE